VRKLYISNMERHHQHTSPFPPEFRTTHNFFTKEVFVMPLHLAFFDTRWRARVVGLDVETVLVKTDLLEAPVR